MREYKVNNQEDFEDIWRKFYEKLPKDVRKKYDKKLHELVQDYIGFTSYRDEELQGDPDTLYSDLYKKAAKQRDYERNKIDKKAREAWKRGDIETTIAALIELDSLPTSPKRSKKYIIEFFKNMVEDYPKVFKGEQKTIKALIVLIS